MIEYELDQKLSDAAHKLGRSKSSIINALLEYGLNLEEDKLIELITLTK
jgi:predicted DNA-binding protein